MPRPLVVLDSLESDLPGQGQQVLGYLKSSLQLLHQQQEQSLASVTTLLRSLDGNWLPATTSVEHPEEKQQKDCVQSPVVAEALKLDSAEISAEGLFLQDNEPILPDSPVISHASSGRIKTLRMGINDMVSINSRFGSIMGPGIAPTRSVGGDGLGAWVQYRCQQALDHPMSDYVVGFIILLNSICIGIETELSIKGGEYSFPGQQLDIIFVSIYIVEIAMRLIAHGMKSFSDSWFLFDISLVATGFLSNIVLPVVFLAAENSGNNSALESVQLVLVVRSVRLLRLIRALRMLRMFRTVWRLVYGLLTSGNAMLSTFFLLLLFIYIFSCVGVELITKSPHLTSHPDTQLIVENSFGSLQRTLLTLMAFVAADSVASVYFPLIVEKPVLCLYFVPLLLVVSVALMNLVTAVLVEGALSNASADKEMAKHDMKKMVTDAIPKLMDLFRASDVNDDGMLTIDEVKDVPMDILPTDFFEALEGIHSMEEVFEMLDVTGDGCLTQVEFAEGLLHLCLNDMPIQQVQTLKLLRLNEAKIDRMTDLLLTQAGQAQAT